MVLKQDMTIHILQLHTLWVSIYKSLFSWGHEQAVAIAPTHHRRGSISNLLVLQVSQFTQDLGSWVLHFQQLQDGCPVVGDGHVLQKEP